MTFPGEARGKQGASKRGESGSVADSFHHGEPQIRLGNGRHADTREFSTQTLKLWGDLADCTSTRILCRWQEMLSLARCYSVAAAENTLAGWIFVG